jgi:hypothetical protein
MSSQTTNQQRGVLLIALLGIRKMNRNPKPTRKEVLHFIQRKKLIAWNEHEIDLLDSNCSVGENRISWRRKDFVMDGLLKHAPSKSSWPANWHLLGPNRTEYGLWELTDSGLAKAVNIVKDWMQQFEENGEFFDELRREVAELKLTDEFMNLVLQLAHNDFKTVFHPKS